MPLDIIGQQLGQLRILRQLGEGGMGAVFLAEHSQIGAHRAVKVLHSQYTQVPAIVQRFLNEARASGKLKHRNIVGVHDMGQLSDGSFYIAFEYVPGQTLAQLIDSGHGTAILPREIVRIVSQIASALRLAHSSGIVHRDLKPENVLLTSRDGDDQHVMILDWGIARLSESAEGAPRTQTGMLLGTIVYMSPEQLLGRHVDASTDVFALGIIAYRMATGGRFPYQVYEVSVDDYYRLTPLEIGLRQRDHLIVDPRAHNPHLPEGFARALLAALAVDAAQRPRPEEYALMLANEVQPDGRDVVKTYARDLLVDASAVAVSSGLAASTPIDNAKPETPRYRLGRHLGAGGMAEVFLASTSIAGIERTVAVKRVLPNYARDAHFVKMFLDEARIAAQLQHPNIVTIIDFARDEDQQPFIAMEYVDGRDLHAVAKTIATTGPLPISVVIFVITEILYALKFAHNLPRGSAMRGVVHRDISPHNVLLSWDGAVKLSDFGLAKARTGPVAVASILLKGKPAYMSPEQVDNHDLDGRSDLFAVGVVLWELLAGRVLFEGQGAEEVLHRVKHGGEIHPPSRHNVNVKSDLDRVTLTLLERDIGKRYATADAAIAALRRCSDADPGGRDELVRLLALRFPEEAAARSSRSLQMSSPMPTVPALRASVLSAVSPTTHGAASGHAVQATRRTRWHWVTGGVIAAVVAAVALIATQVGGTASTPTSATPTAPSSSGAATRVMDAPRTNAKLTIVTEPAGALVRIDGIVYGRAPVTASVALGVQLAVDAEHERFAPAKEIVTVDRDQTVTVRLRELPSPPQPAIVAPRPTDTREPPAKPSRAASRKKPHTPASVNAGSGSNYDPNGVSTNPDI